MTKVIVDLDAYTRPELGGFREPPVVADAVRSRVLISQLLDVGITTFLCPPEPRLLRILLELRRERSFEVVPLLVDAARHARELQTYGLIGFALRRLSAAGPIGALRTSLESVPHLAAIARNDYADASVFLAGLELAQFARFHPRSAFLHANSADLATTSRNRRLFERFDGLARRRGLAPGVVTNNAGWLVPLLDRWGLAMTVAAPVAVSGYRMKPTREICLERAQRSRQRFHAVLPRTDGIEEVLGLPAFEAVIAAPPDAAAALTLVDRARSA